jgi:hypothetical protein
MMTSEPVLIQLSMTGLTYSDRSDNMSKALPHPIPQSIVEVVKCKALGICTSTISHSEGLWVFVCPAPLWSDGDAMNIA